MRKSKEAWLDLTSYLLMTLIITMFILFFINNRSELQAMLFVLVLFVSFFLLLRCIKLEKNKRRYEALFRWLQGDQQELDELPDELKEDISRLLQELEKKNSYETLQAHMEFAVLQNQINPHFLYNTLDAIRSQALAVHANEIADMTGRLSRFFRYSIKNQGNLVTVADELKNIEDYFAIQHYRFEDRFSLEYHSEDDSVLKYYIPKMTFQPLVENALYHGLEPKKGNGKIVIRLHKGAQSLHVVISDNGVGMDENKLAAINARFHGDTPAPAKPGERRTGIALYNVNKRLQLLFGKIYGLHMTSSPGNGTDVEIQLPLVDDEQRSKYQQ